MWNRAYLELLIRALTYMVGFHLYANRGAQPMILRGHMLRITALRRLITWLQVWMEPNKSLPPYIEGEERALCRTAVQELLILGSNGPETLNLQLGFGMSYLDKLSAPSLLPDIPPRILTFYWGVQLMREAVKQPFCLHTTCGLIERMDSLLPEVLLAFLQHEADLFQVNPRGEFLTELTAAAEFARGFPDVNDHDTKVRLCYQHPFVQADLLSLKDLIG